jgi:hypothetical protein
MWVPSETGASYGDLDPEYLTANYRVYLNEPDAKRVFAYIKKLQASSPLWNAETSIALRLSVASQILWD